MPKLSEWFLSLCSKLANALSWWRLRKKIRPFDRTCRYVNPSDMRYHMRLAIAPLKSGRKDGIVLLTDNKRIKTYVNKCLVRNNIHPWKLLCLPARVRYDQILGHVKKHFSVCGVEYSVEGYDEDEPFFIFRVPNVPSWQELKKSGRGRHSKRSGGGQKHNNKGGENVQRKR